MESPGSVIVPRFGPNDDVVTLLRWLVVDGAHVRRGTPIAELETSKATIEVAAECEGYLTQSARQNDELRVGAEFAHVSAAPTAIDARSALPQQPAHGGPRWSRVALARAQELHVPIEAFEKMRFVREADVMHWLESNSPGSHGDAEAPPRAIRHDATKRAEIRNLRTGSNGRLLSSATIAVPGLITTSGKQGLEALASIVSATAKNLRSFPQFNADVDDYEIRHYAQINVGVALNLGKGLKVATVYDAGEKSVDAISHELGRLAAAYVRDRLSLHDLTASTFTISDLTSLRVSAVAPLLNGRQSALLAVHAGYDQHSWNMTLTFDHRAADALLASRFLRAVARSVALDPSGPRNACSVCGNRIDACRGRMLVQVETNDGPSKLCLNCILRDHL